MYAALYNRSCDAFWLGNFSFENSSADCVPITRCPGLLNSTLAPSRSAVCGFDEESQLLMVCCPADQVTEPQDLSQPPLYPSPSGEARKVEDKSDLCFDWSINEEACLLYRHFPKGKVTSRDMFDFMQRTCPRTCGWVESGCHDEHPRCPEWSRLGMCATAGLFMAHTCRESCGVCGFLAPHNKVCRSRIYTVSIV